jgi:micrococcal nuclease
VNTLAACLLALAMILAIAAINPSAGAIQTKAVENVQSASAWIAIDGDTIRSPAGVTHRIMGMDTPETFQARCNDELALGLMAKMRMEQLLAAGGVTILESGKLDRYGRTLSQVRVGERDIADIMIGEGLARPYAGGKRQSWCERHP